MGSPPRGYRNLCGLTARRPAPPLTHKKAGSNTLLTPRIFLQSEIFVISVFFIGDKMAKDGTNRGGRRVREGDKPKPLAEKIAAGEDADIIEFTPSMLEGAELEDAADLAGEDMPSPGEYLSAQQKNGKRNANHPTSKPLDLLGYPIGNSTQENGVVIDTFGGSGSTLMACEQMNRICYMMELDENTPPSFSGATLKTPVMLKAYM